MLKCAALAVDLFCLWGEPIPNIELYPRRREDVPDLISLLVISPLVADIQDGRQFPRQSLVLDPHTDEISDVCLGVLERISRVQDAKVIDERQVTWLHS